MSNRINATPFMREDIVIAEILGITPKKSDPRLALLVG
jgi:hypothetical protein